MAETHMAETRTDESRMTNEGIARQIGIPPHSKRRTSEHEHNTNHVEQNSWPSAQTAARLPTSHSNQAGSNKCYAAHATAKIGKIEKNARCNPNPN